MLVCVLSGYPEINHDNVLTKRVPRTVWDCASLVLLHAKQVLSSQKLPDSWLLHGPVGG